MVGAELATVAVGEVIAPPVSAPSVGVTVTEIVSPRSYSAPVRLALVCEMGAPEMVQS